MQLIDIVGGSGFIGTSLVSKLINNPNISVLIIDKKISAKYPKLTVICDICNKENLRKAIRDNSIIIHLAAEHRDDVYPPDNYYSVNVEGTRNICDVALQKNVKKIIFTSSVAVYGPNDSKKPIDEDYFPNPINHYGKSKLQAEDVLKQWQKKFQNEFYLTIIRPTVVFGIGNRGNLYNLLKQIYDRKFIMIGNGNNIKSLAYVENISFFIKTLLNQKEHLIVVNYVDKPDLNINELLAKVLIIMGRNPHIGLRIPRSLGISIGFIFDIFSYFLKRKLSISSTRIRKFTSNTVYSSKNLNTNISNLINLDVALKETIEIEFINKKFLEK